MGYFGITGSYFHGIYVFAEISGIIVASEIDKPNAMGRIRSGFSEIKMNVRILRSLACIFRQRSFPASFFVKEIDFDITYEFGTVSGVICALAHVCASFFQFGNVFVGEIAEGDSANLRESSIYSHIF